MKKIFALLLAITMVTAVFINFTSAVLFNIIMLQQGLRNLIIVEHIMKRIKNLKKLVSGPVQRLVFMKIAYHMHGMIMINYSKLNNKPLLYNRGLAIINVNIIIHDIDYIWSIPIMINKTI
jgi:hypothetical protein